MTAGTWTAALLVCVTVATAAPVRAQGPQRVPVRVENPAPLERRDEVVSIPWIAVTRALPGVTPAGARMVDAAGRVVVSQVLDNEADGRPDSLLFLTDLAPLDARAFWLERGDPVRAPARVALRHDPPRDDMAWESDRIAFRIYGEGLKRTPSAMSSSGIDVWLKRTRDLILEKWYAKGHDAYHLDTGEGADFFDVGTTLGVGGTALWLGDTIHRADNFKAHRIIANGPIRAIFELDYSAWGTPAVQVTETKRFTIDAGRSLYRQESVFRSRTGSPVPYVTGVVKRPGMIAAISRNQPWVWLTGWGPVAPKNGGHGELGTAVMLPAARLEDWKEVHGHYLAVSHAQSGVPVVHYIGAAWTAGGDFPTPQSWWRHLDEQARRLASPVRTTIGG